MDIGAVVGVVLFLAFVGLVVVLTVRTVRSAKRAVSRRTAQARRFVEDSRLRARRYTLPGPVGDVVQLRLDLRASIDSTFTALEHGHSDDASLAEAQTLLSRLNEHARALDAELKLLENEPDRARVANRLPVLTDRTRRITRSADSLRWAAQDRARHFADDDLAALDRDIALETHALRHWTPTPAPDAAGPQKLSPPGS